MFAVMRKGFFSIAAVAALATLLPLNSSAQGPAAKNRAVFQVSDADPQKWTLTLNNARNMQAELGGDVDIEIAVYGPGIGMLKRDSAVSKNVAEALHSGVKVVACQNTMKNQKLIEADMLAEIGYVPAGVVELMRKQQQGWAYIRP